MALISVFDAVGGVMFETAPGVKAYQMVVVGAQGRIVIEP